mgnify:CR=1 FL=1
MSRRLARRLAPALAILAAIAGVARAQTAPLAPVEQTALAKDAFSTGLLDRSQGALASDLWRGSTARALEPLLNAAPARPASPSIGAALRRVLLSPGDAPADAGPALGGAKLKALVAAGFIDAARSIEGLSAGANADPASVEAMAVADLLAGEEDAACSKARRIASGGDTAFWVKLRVICYARANELDAAELALGILTENGWASAEDRAVFAPLAAGARPKTAPEPVDALQLAAAKAMGAPIAPGFLDRASGGVVKSVADDDSRDWTMRLAAARRAAAMGVMSAAELRALYAASGDAASAFRAIGMMTAPEFIRDKAARIAGQIDAASDFESLFAASVLYADDIKALEGAVMPAADAARFALARLAIGDAVGAERWLTSAAGDVVQGLPDDQMMRFIDTVGVLGALEPAAAGRVAAAANVAPSPPRLSTEQNAAPSADLAFIVASAIDAAARGAKGEAALAALAASGAAEQGDPVAEAVTVNAFAAAGLDDIVRRRTVEKAIAALYPDDAPPAAESALTPASAPSGLTPRLKPKRAT